MRLDLKTGFSCDNHCRFCVQGDKRKHHRDKDTATLKAILDEARTGTDEVVLTGGEVTLRKDIVELVGHAKSLRFRVIQIQTNGKRLADIDFVKDLASAGATEFSPAIHGATPEVHDALTQSPGAFKQTVAGVMNVKSLGLPVILNSVITQANVTQLPRMARLFVRLRVDQFQFAFVHALGSAEKNFGEIVPRLSEAAPQAVKGLRIGVEAGVRCFTEAIPLCFLPGMERHAAEWVIPRTRIVDATWEIPDYTQYRLTEGKTKGPPCTRCRFAGVCEGPWREYPEHFGWSEFVPVPPLASIPTRPSPTTD